MALGVINGNGATMMLPVTIFDRGRCLCGALGRRRHCFRFSNLTCVSGFVHFFQTPRRQITIRSLFLISRRDLVDAHSPFAGRMALNAEYVARFFFVCPWF
jgi:hypothetical protein